VSLTATEIAADFGKPVASVTWVSVQVKSIHQEEQYG